MAVISVHDVDFRSIVNSTAKPIVLQFWAEWCGPCRMIAPLISELSDQFSSELVFLRMNVDENPKTASEYGVMSIPTLFVLKRSELISRQVGAAPKEKLAKWIQESGALEKGPDNLEGQETIGIALIQGELKLVSLTHDGQYRFLDSNSIYHNIYLTKSVIIPRQQKIVREFEELLNSSGTTERMFQEFFSSYPDFIINDDYRKVHSQVVLENLDAGPLIPDFVLEPYNSNSFCDILELKRPDAKLFVEKKNRPRFSAAVFEAVAQLREYHEYFEQEQNRKIVESSYGLKLFRPRLILIIGRRGKLSPIQLRKAQSDFPTVVIQTYDDLLERYKRKST